MQEITDVYLRTLREIANRSNQIIVLSIIAVLGSTILAYEYGKDASVPLIGITTTPGRATLTLLVIYFLLGFVGINIRARWESNLEMLAKENPKLKSAVILFPCIFNSGPVLKILTILLSIGALEITFQSGEKPMGWATGLIVAILLASPYIRMFMPLFLRTRTPD